MKRSLISSFSAAAAALTFLSASAAGVSLRSGGKLWLDGKSTVHEFKSTAGEVEAAFDQDLSRWPSGGTGAGAWRAFLEAKGVTSMDLTIAVSSLHSGKAGLDKNMYKALKASEHPQIRFHMSSYEVADGKAAGVLAIGAKGTLQVAGVEHEIRIPLSATIEGEDLRLRSSVPLLMTDYGIKPPTMMMGALRTADQVMVSFDLVLEHNGEASAAKGQ